MADLRVGLRVDAETGAARKEIDETAKSVERMGEKARASGRKAAEGGKQTQEKMQLAAGSVANLTAQFNDIGQMLAAGQSPLMLAIQQGTQITQVIGPMGAAGAVRALGQALMSMLSPMNLITLGSIAAGAALVQWFTSSKEEARSLADELDGLRDSIREMEKLRELSVAPLSELRIDFGDSAAQVRELYSAMADLALLDATNNIVGAAQAMRTELEDITGYVRQLQVLDNALTLGEHPDDQAFVRRRILSNLREDFGLTEQEARDLAAALDELAGARGPDQIAAAVGRVNEAFDRVLERTRDLPETTREAARAAREMAIEVVRVNAAMEGHSRSAEKARQDAEAMLATLNDEAQIRAAIKVYGEDSVQVERLRVEQARAAFAARVEEMQISDELKQSLMEAWDAARGLATEDIAGGIAAAAAQASALAGEMERAWNAAANAAAAASDAARESQLRLQFQDDPVKLAGALAEQRFKARVGDYSGFDPILRSQIEQRLAETVAAAEEAARNQQELASSNRGGRSVGRSVSRSASAATIRDTDKTRDAFERLRASVDDAYAAQQRYAEAERIVNDAVRQGIVSKDVAADVLERVKQGLDGASRGADQFAESLKSGVLDALTGVTSLEDAFSNLIRVIQRAALEALLFNQGMFATQGGGSGLLGGFISSLTGWIGGGAAVHHSGGVVGSVPATRRVDPRVFLSAPRMHSGGWAGLRPDEVPAILQRGERVLSRREVAQMGSGGQPAVNITINARDAESFRKSRTQIAADISRAISIGRRGM